MKGRTPERIFLQRRANGLRYDVAERGKDYYAGNSSYRVTLVTFRADPVRAEGPANALVVTRRDSSGNIEEMLKVDYSTLTAEQEVYQSAKAAAIKISKSRKLPLKESPKPAHLNLY